MEIKSEIKEEVDDDNFPSPIINSVRSLNCDVNSNCDSPPAEAQSTQAPELIEVKYEVKEEEWADETDDKNLYCSKCYKDFRQPKNLESHEKICHLKRRGGQDQFEFPPHRHRPQQ